MAITNLTNTKWRLNDNLTLIQSSQTFSINFWNAGGCGEWMSGLGFYYNSGSSVHYLRYRSRSDSDWDAIYDSDGWRNENDKTIFIRDGSDVTNATLIAWLEANATLIDLDISDLTGTTWRFTNETLIPYFVYIPSAGEYGHKEFNVNFTSNNTQFSKINWENDTDFYRMDMYYYNGSNDEYIVTDGDLYESSYNPITITGGTDATDPFLINFLIENAQQISVKTFDLSTLQLSAGTHEIKVRARGSGYRDSNFSNSVSYTKQVNNIKIHFVNKGYGQLGYRVNNGSWVWCPTGYQTLDATLNNVAKFEVVIEETGGVDDLTILTAESGGTIVYQTLVGNTTDNPLDITQYLQDGYYITAYADD